MDSVMKGLMGQCPLRILGLEPPLSIRLLYISAYNNDGDNVDCADV